MAYQCYAKGVKQVGGPRDSANYLDVNSTRELAVKMRLQRLKRKYV